MAHTITKAAATASAAAGSVRQLPGVLKPSVITLQTLALGGYRVVSLTKGIARRAIVIGAALLVVGVAAAIQNATLFGVGGLIAAWTGGYLIVLGTWQRSGSPRTLNGPKNRSAVQRCRSRIRQCLSRPLLPLLSATLVGAMLSLACPVVRRWLFGTDQQHSGLIGAHVYWLGAAWWHPLIAIGVIALAFSLTAVAAANLGRRERRANRSSSAAGRTVRQVQS